MSTTVLASGSLVLMLFLLGIRVPIGVAMGAVAFGGFWYIGNINIALAVVRDTPFSFAASWDLSAIPMFLLMGSIASNAGIASGLFRAARAWFGGLPGGLAVATNWACAGFGAASGSSIAAAAVVARIAVPEMLKTSIPLTETLSYPVYRLWMSAVCIALAIGMYLLIQKSRLGMMIRAGAANREMVQSLGINIVLLYRLVFALGVALAAFAGMIAAPVASVFPGMGNQVLIVCFVVVVIGGIGSVKGAMAASLMIGLAETFGQVLVPEVAGMIVYVLMAIVLVWRPEGLFGRS